jgi:hypothetical protein
MAFFIPRRVVAEESGAAHFGFGGAMLLDRRYPFIGLCFGEATVDEVGVHLLVACVLVVCKSRLHPRAQVIPSHSPNTLRLCPCASRLQCSPATRTAARQS